MILAGYVQFIQNSDKLAEIVKAYTDRFPILTEIFVVVFLVGLFVKVISVLINSK